METLEENVEEGKDNEKGKEERMYVLDKNIVVFTSK